MTAAKTMKRYTLVQHSGFGYAGDEQFRHAVESRHLPGKREENLVLKAGGVVFDSYAAAEDAAMEFNYPTGVEGLIPHTEGTFSNRTVDDLAIYMPPSEELRQQLLRLSSRT